MQQERLNEWVGNERKKRGKKQEKSWEKKEGRKERPARSKRERELFRILPKPRVRKLVPFS